MRQDLLFGWRFEATQPQHPLEKRDFPMLGRRMRTQLPIEGVLEEALDAISQTPTAVSAEEKAGERTSSHESQ